MAGLVRVACPADAAVIAEVHVASWQAAYRKDFPAAYLDALTAAQRLPRWRHTLESGEELVLVVERDGVVVGVAAVGASRDPDTPAGEGEMHVLYLVPAAWGTGLGAALHAEALDRLGAAGFTEACLWVLHSNSRARRFYDKHGWRPDGGIKQEHRAGLITTEVRYRRALSVPRASGGGAAARAGGGLG